MKNTMKATVKMRKGMKKGFTLVELLFVMAVISILAGFGISQMSGSTDTALNTVAKGNIMSTTTEATLYFAENSASYVGFTPSIEGVTVSNVTKGSYCIEATGAEGVSYKYDSAADSKVSEGTCSGGGNQIVMG
jgi:prepilin-type N-terminal cleavage/methylation domain-containing protein